MFLQILIYWYTPPTPLTKPANLASVQPISKSQESILLPLPSCRRKTVGAIVAALQFRFNEYPFESPYHGSCPVPSCPVPCPFSHIFHLLRTATSLVLSYGTSEIDIHRYREMGGTVHFTDCMQAATSCTSFPYKMILHLLCAFILIVPQLNGCLWLSLISL